MKGRGVAVVAGVVAFGAIMLGAGVAGSSSAPAGETVTRDAPWRLVAVSRDGRTLRLVHDSSGCWWQSRGMASATEAPGDVEVTVRQTRPGPEPGEEEACVSIAGLGRARVRLAAPIDGRRVRGGPRLGGWCCFFDRWVERPGQDPSYVPRVPRVIGLARTDAVGALKFQHFRVRTRPRRTGGQVVAQEPAPGTVIGDWDGRRPVTTVRLMLRR